jgi:hypothetical protein
VGNGNLFRSDCQTFAFNWIRGRKNKVNQGCSSWLKVDQGILKHFFMKKKPSTRQARRLATWSKLGKPTGTVELQ